MGLRWGRSPFAIGEDRNKPGVRRVCPLMCPTLLRLPFWLLDHGFRLERAVACDPRWERARAAVPRLRLSGPEQRFVLGLLQRRRNYWLWRCDQKAACGDFAVVDLSDPVPARRRAWVLELKERSDWRDGRGLQLLNARIAHDELVELGVLTPDSTVLLREASTSAALDALTR